MKNEIKTLRDNVIAMTVNQFISQKQTFTLKDLKDTLSIQYDEFNWTDDIVKSYDLSVHQPLVEKNGTYVSSTKKRVDNRIGKKAALEKMMASNGQFLSTHFMKADGSLRKFNGKVLKDADMSLGYVKMKSPKGEIRNVNLQTLKKLIIGGQEFKIR